MSRGRDFRGPRKRGFDDDNFWSNEPPRGPRAPRPFGGGFSPEPPMAAGPAVEATVKWFNAEKGFGFAELGDGTGDAFLHIAVLQRAGRDNVPPGAKLRVTVGQGQKGRQITSVLDVDESTATAAPPRRSGPGMEGRPPRRQIDPSTAVEMTGTVKWFNTEKGFGFVAVEAGGKDVFVHAAVLERSGVGPINEGQRVSMRVVEGMKGREAISVSLLD